MRLGRVEPVTIPAERRSPTIALNVSLLFFLALTFYLVTRKLTFGANIFIY